jgi:hypothetical protein
MSRRAWFDQTYRRYRHISAAATTGVLQPAIEMPFFRNPSLEHDLDDYRVLNRALSNLSIIVWWRHPLK